MDGVLIPAALAALYAAAAVASWRHARRAAGAVLGAVGLAFGLIAIRNAPGPLVVALLVAALLVVGVVTAWPLLTRRAGSGTEGQR